MKILVAEDSNYFRKILENTLLKWDYEVVLASDGAEAWKILQQNDAPRLAILDWVMPNMTGIEVCKGLRVRETGSYVYIILLTAKSSKENIIAGLEAGVDDYIVKPFDEEVLKYRLKIGQRILTLEDKIMQLASTDALTGILNRRAFMEQLEGEMHRHNRLKQPLSVIMIDLDNFKRINDDYGHQVGDKTLRQVAQELSSKIRKYDFIGRYGGEEFIVCTPGVDANGAKEIAERLRLGIESLRISLPSLKIELRITTSLGVSYLEQEEEATLDDLVRAADEALYIAKRSGKNQVYCKNDKNF